MKNFTLIKPTFFHLKKLMALALFFNLMTLFFMPAQAQNPIVTNSATYDVFMNIDPARGLNPTSMATDISTYLTTMGAATNSYRIITSAVTLDPTDIAKWEVYDHYDYQWYANEAAWLASPGGFNNGNIPSNWYYYGVNDPYGDGVKRTIAQLLASKGTVGSTWGICSYLQSHIYPFVENGKPAMQFYGYSASAAADFLYYPADVASTKTVKFDVDAQLIDPHTLISAGYLINGGTTGTGSSKTISGYLLLISASLNSVTLYRLNDGVNVDALHNSGSGAPGTVVATYSATIPSKSHIEMSITSTSVTATIQALDASGNLTGSKSTMFNSQALTNSGFGGFGPFVLYSSHGCSSASAFRFSNIEMALGSVLAGNSSLESYQFSEYLDNSPNRFFVNLTNTSATNYTGTSNDMDNAYLTKIKDDNAIVITDESTGTYLPGTLNENIKNVTTEPTEATVAAALGLADLSSLTVEQKLAAKLAYLIYNTTLGEYGTIPTPTTTAVASLYLLDGPGTDANWTGANQVNEILSWMVSGSNINIYLNPDNSVNNTGLTATYKLKDPSGTITTITTSTDINGKKYFAFPKTSGTGDYSVTLSYAIGGSITSTVPSTSTFKYAPVPPLEGNPSISGTMQYGQVLTITPNITTVPGLTGTLSNQWKANGTNISGATDATYTLTANEVGKTISCDITSNVQTGTVSESASGTVSKITLATATVSTVNSKAYNGTTATTGGTISFSGTVNSENPTSTSSIVWTSANAGTNTVNVSGISLTSLSDRYDLSVTSLSNVTPGNNPTISKATPTVSVYPTATAIAYGQTLQSSTLTTSSAIVNGYSGAIAGSYAWKTSTTEPTSAGNFTTATVSFTPADATNYNGIDFDISVTVTKVMLTVTADNKTKVYDGAVFNPFTVTYNGFIPDESPANLGGTLAYSGAATTAVNAGTNYVITPLGLTSGNYNISFVAGKLDITKKALTITADPKTKVYGQADPLLTYQITSGDLESGDSFSGSLSRVAGENVADYAIAIGTVSAGTNYDLSFVTSDLSISQKEITITADAKSKVYGETDPALTYQITSGDLESGDSFSGSLSRFAGENVADYAISIGTVSAGSNYDLSFVTSDLSITQKEITITADAKSKVYGESDPPLTYQITSGDLESGDSFTGSLSRAAGENVADLAIAIGTVSAGSNYDLSFVTSDLSITQKEITITADAKSKVYGETDPALTYQITVGSLVGDDAFSGSLSRAAGENVSDYEIVIGIVSAGANYDLSFVTANLSITQKTLTITADSKSKVYGEANPALTISWDGFVNEEDQNALINAPGIFVNTDNESNAGVYTISISGAVSNNYAIEYNEGTLEVTKALLTVSAVNASKKYLEAVPAFIVSYSGFVNNDTQSVLNTLPSASTNANINSDAGTYDIIASGASDNNYDFQYNKGVLTILKADQVITFNAIPVGLRTTQEYSLDATASSQLSVEFFTSEPAVATISGTNLKVEKEGTVQIIVRQEGNHNWNPAIDVFQTVIMLPAFDNIRSLFTPNNDGMNDYWYIPDIEQYGIISVQIYNRFGKLLYKSSAYKNDWEGTYNGTPLPEAAYYYIIKSSEKGLIKGVVNIVR